MMFFLDKKYLSVGKLGEDCAVVYLKKQGYKILHRNWYNTKGKRLGEIDIVAQTVNGEIVFVEVKTRVVHNAHDTVYPEEQITQGKLHKLRRVAECYIASFDLWHCQWRMDAVSICVAGQNVCDIKHIQNIYF